MKRSIAGMLTLLITAAVLLSGCPGKHSSSSMEQQNRPRMSTY